MPALKVLHSVHQRTFVDWWVSRHIGISRKVTNQAKQSREPWDARIGLTGYNRSLKRWQLFPIIFLRQLHVAPKSLNGAPVAGILRLYLRQDAGNVAPADNVVFEEYGQVAFLGLIVESEGEVLWIYFANV